MTTETTADTLTPDVWAKNALPMGEPWQVELLARARETLEGNIVRAPAWGNRRGIVPAHNRYDGVWNWDAAFHALAVVRWDPELAWEQVSIVWDLQLPSGALPDVLYATGKLVDEFGKPPVFPWVIAELDRRDPNLAVLEALYPKLVAYEAFWRRERGGDEHGLFHYGGANPEWESGWDDSVRWDHGTSNLWTIDLNSFMVMLYDAMAQISGRLGIVEDGIRWAKAKAALAESIETRLWNPDCGAYMDYDYDRGAFTGVLTPASFTPLYARFASKQHAAAMAGHGADPAKFYPSMPTVAFDDPEFSATYFRGPCWINPAVFGIEGMRRYGFTATADEIQRTVLKRCYDVGDLYEYYDAKTGQPGIGAVARFGWTAAFVIEMLLDRQSR